MPPTTTTSARTMTAMRPPPLSSWAGCAATGERRAALPEDPGRCDELGRALEAAGLAEDAAGLAPDAGFVSAGFGLSAFLASAGF
jgi:hypothetical protein